MPKIGADAANPVNFSLDYVSRFDGYHRSEGAGHHYVAGR